MLRLTGNQVWPQLRLGSRGWWLDASMLVLRSLPTR
jgi:hypothetical protein